MMREFKTLEEAQKIKAIREESIVPGAPLRYRPVIVSGPDEGFCVVELGFAEKEGFEVIQ